MLAIHILWQHLIVIGFLPRGFKGQYRHEQHFHNKNQLFIFFLPDSFPLSHHNIKLISHATKKKNNQNTPLKPYCHFLLNFVKCLISDLFFYCFIFKVNTE